MIDRFVLAVAEFVGRAHRVDGAVGVRHREDKAREVERVAERGVERVAAFAKAEK